MQMQEVRQEQEARLFLLADASPLWPHLDDIGCLHTALGQAMRLTVHHAVLRIERASTVAGTTRRRAFFKTVSLQKTHSRGCGRSDYL
jgi:hypothetical protein